MVGEGGGYGRWWVARFVLEVGSKIGGWRSVALLVVGVGSIHERKKCRKTVATR